MRGSSVPSYVLSLISGAAVFAIMLLVIASLDRPQYCPGLQNLARDGVVVWQNERNGDAIVCTPLATYHERRGE